MLTDLDLIVYGVPNSDPPPRPVLEVVPVSPEPGEQDFVTEVKINLRAGTTLGETWRLRRSAVESQNIAKMPIVSTGAMGTLDAANGLQSAIYRDDGPVQIAATASLRPWVRYSWVAEIQGVPGERFDRDRQSSPGALVPRLRPGQPDPHPDRGAAAICDRRDRRRRRGGPA